MENDTVAIRLVESVGPLLAGGDWPAAVELLRAQWPPDRLAALLASPQPEVTAIAARCLALTGSMSHCAALVRHLGHAEETVVCAAEEALWHIWMQASCPAARPCLARAVEHIRTGEYSAAVELLDALAAAEPGFAEVHHQRAIALHFLGRLEQAAEAYQKVLTLNPYHYAAAAGLGHTCVERGDVRRALKFYRLALQLHPGLADIGQAVKQIEKALGQREVA